MGGEYSVRGFDIRSIGPSDPDTGLVLGGNKSLLFNAEYLISIVNPVRLIFFYDAGQVVDEGQQFAMENFRTSTGAEVRFFMPVLNVPFRLIFAHNPQRERRARQQLPAGEGIRVPVRGRFDVLMRKGQREMRWFLVLRRSA